MSVCLLTLAATCAIAQQGPLRIEVTEGVAAPIPLAIPRLVGTSDADSQWADRITQVIIDDLVGTGLFRRIDPNLPDTQLTDFDAPITYEKWQTIDARALLTGEVSVIGEQVAVKFRLFDVFAKAPMGDGLRFSGTTKAWRRIAHKVSDQVYSRITGEGGYFDSRIVFVAESGPKNNRIKRLAVMDYDGADIRYLTDGRDIVLAPRFSPQGDRVIYTSYASGRPQIYQISLGAITRERLDVPGDAMTFSPRFSPDGRAVLFSAASGSNTDIYRMVLGGQAQRLTSDPSIDTAPSFDPDGAQIVFESDRSGAPQLYTMSSTGGAAKRISRGPGRYGTPIWSPRGDFIAFTKQHNGRFHIGVMRPDGGGERLLTSSFLDEGPSWAPNGRVLVFTRESSGSDGMSKLFAIDISGQNLRPVPTENGGSDASWSPLLR